MYSKLGVTKLVELVLVEDDDDVPAPVEECELDEDDEFELEDDPGELTLNNVTLVATARTKIAQIKIIAVEFAIPLHLFFNSIC
jgi:hypothetical protein